MLYERNKFQKMDKVRMEEIQEKMGINTKRTNKNESNHTNSL